MNKMRKHASRNIRRVVITGPTGVIGTALAKRMRHEGIEVYAVIRPESRRLDALKALGVQLIPCDISELSALPNRINGGADAFFHFAWADTTGAGRNNMTSQIANIQYTMDAVCAAKMLGCQVFLGAGSQAEYGRVEGRLQANTPCFPENGYGMAKLCAGQMSRVECEMQKIDHVWMRILSVYGPGDHSTAMISGTIQKLLRGEKPQLTAGEQNWDYLYADDAAEAFYLAAVYGQSGHIYPLGSGQARPLKEYVRILRDQISPDLEIGFGEVPYSPLQVMYLEADISDLQRDTGFVPKTKFEDGIQRTICWIKQQM